MNRLLKLFLLIFVYICAFCTISYASFADISGHWCEEAIVNFKESSFLDGYDDGSFRPDNAITRAELCKIINSYMNYEVSGEWQQANMAKAKIEGYLTTGRANDLISREEAFVALSRVMKLDNIEFELSYEDSGDISIWAVSAIKSLSCMKYITGYESNSLKPKQNITRAEVVKVLYDFVGIGGVDEEIEDMKFAIGYLSHNKYGIEFVEIEKDLEIQSGDSIKLAATTAEKDIAFEIISGKEFVEFDEETLALEGIKNGVVKISVETLNEKKTIIINIK